MGGDFNAKHPQWGSRLANPRGRILYNVIRQESLSFLSTGQPSYWPSDTNKIPDLIDFFLIRGLSHKYYKVESCLDLSSDHSPIIATISNTIIESESLPILTNRLTDWDYFRELVNYNISLELPLHTPAELDAAVNSLTSTFQKSAWEATPCNTCLLYTSRCV